MRIVLIIFSPTFCSAQVRRNPLKRIPRKTRQSDVGKVFCWWRYLIVSSKLLEYSSRKVCARYYGQNQRFRSFSTVDPTTRTD